MSSPTSQIIEQYLPKLQVIFLENVFAGRKPTLTLTHVAHDRRSHPRIAKELANCGFINRLNVEGDPLYAILPVVLQSLPEASFDICAIWTMCLGSRSTFAVSKRPWVRASAFDLAQKKLILESNSYDFFVVSRDAYSDWGNLAEERATVVEHSTNKFQRYWDGPFHQIADAQIVLRGNPELVMAISSEQLRQFVVDELETRKFKSVYLNNALWGLVACGIVEQRVVFDESNSPLLDSHFRGSSHQFPYVTPVANVDEALWESNLEQAITYATAEIERLNSKLTRLQTIASGIARFGGWGKFMERYAELLKHHLANESSSSTSDSELA